METKYLIIAGGVLIFAIVVFQVLTGTRKINLGLNWHKKFGYLLLFFAMIHATLAIIYLTR